MHCHVEIKDDEDQAALDLLHNATVQYSRRKNWKKVTFGEFLLALMRDDPDALEARLIAREIMRLPRHSIKKGEK